MGTHPNEKYGLGFVPYRAYYGKDWVQKAKTSGSSMAPGVRAIIGQGMPVAIAKPMGSATGAPATVVENMPVVITRPHRMTRVVPLDNSLPTLPAPSGGWIDET